jgi:hypothetical protein
MKMISAVVLIVLAFSAVPLVHSCPCAGSSVPSFMTLDVCNVSGNVISVNADSPALQESSCKLCPLLLWGHAEVIHSSCKLAMVFFQLERPPKS